MSIIFANIIAEYGSVQLSIGTGAPADPVESQGLLLDDAGAIYATTTGPATVFAYGLPFDANGRLYVEDAAVDYYAQSIPFTASGAVAVSATDAGGHFSQGMQFGPAGGFYVSGGLGPTAENVVLFSMGAGGLEAWDMDQSPYVEVTAIDPLPEAAIYGLAYDATNRRLAVGGTQVHIYDTSTFPFTFVESITLNGDNYDVLKFSPDGSLLFAGVYDTGSARNNYLINMFDSSAVLVTGDSVNGADFTSNAEYLAISRQTGSGNGFKVFDVTDPSAPSADTGYPGESSTGFRAMAMKYTDDHFMTCFVSANDIYELIQPTKAFGGVFDNNAAVADLAFTPDGNFFGVLERSSPFMAIFDSSAASSGSWGARLFDTGANVAGTATNITRPWLATSSDSQFMGLWQTSDGADQNRIVWDLSTNPVERVAAFGGTGGSGFQRMAFVRAPVTP